jgi:hypothetical protein
MEMAARTQDVLFRGGVPADTIQKVLVTFGVSRCAPAAVSPSLEIGQRTAGFAAREAPPSIRLRGACPDRCED